MTIEKGRLKRRDHSNRLRVRYEAEFGYLHSFGHVARELALALISRPEIELRLLPRGQWEFDPRSDIKTRNLVPFLDTDPKEEVEFHIRHHWPPDFSPPSSGRWILAQPWEYGSLPQTWVDAFRDKTDDVWCFSRFVKDAYVRAGFDEQRLSIVPHGIDPEIYHPEVSPLPLKSKKRFKFLFVGGTLSRKGADLLLDAYLTAFSRADDVALVVKDMGTKTFYLNQTMGERFLKAAGDPTRPEIEYLDVHLSEKNLARLYGACNVLVAPYRGEGFSLPVLEAMACGLGVIVTAGGATDDFVDGTCGIRVASNHVELNEALNDGTKCVAPMFFIEPDRTELVRALRWVYENPILVKDLGGNASRRSRLEWNWDRVSDIVVGRLLTLSNRPAIRLSLSHDNGQVGNERPCEAEGISRDDSQWLRRLEILITNGEYSNAIRDLYELIAEQNISASAKPVLQLAEEHLADRKRMQGFFPEAVRKEVLKRVRKALRRSQSMGPRAEAKRQRVSLTMIVKDEEDNIAECIKSVRNMVDEAIIVDTGSKDRTKVIAAAYGAKVFDFAWIDNFARARNEALRHATGDWVFWMDADDRLDEENRGRLTRVFKNLPSKQIVGYVMKVECVARDGGSPTVVDHVRLFPKHSSIRWEYRVHENILPSINRMGGSVVWTDVVIQHIGYLDSNLRDTKRLRDHALLLKNFEEAPEDPFIHFNLGHSYVDAGDLEKAAFHLKETIVLSEPYYSQVKKAYALLSQVERNRGDIESALRVVKEGRVHHPNYPELLYFEGVFLDELDQHAAAAKCFEQILSTDKWPQEFGSFDIGILGHKSLHRLAAINLKLGRRREAEEQLRKVINEQPGYLCALIDLAELYIAENCIEAATGLIERLTANGLRSQAKHLAGKIFQRQGRWEEAVREYDQAIAIDRRNEEARRDLIHLYLSINQVEKAEECIRSSIAEEPRIAQSHFNLAGLLFKQGRMREALESVETALSLNSAYLHAKALKRQIQEKIVQT